MKMITRMSSNTISYSWSMSWPESIAWSWFYSVSWSTFYSWSRSWSRSI